MRRLLGNSGGRQSATPSKTRNSQRARLLQKLSDLQLCFGRGLPLPAASVRRLATSRILPRESRVDALELLGDVLCGADDYAAALSAYDEALRLTRSQREHLLYVKAAALRDMAFVEAARLLDRVRVSELSHDDRIAYWLECLDLGKTCYDLEWLKRLLRRIWRRDRNNESVALEIDFSRRLIDFVEQEYAWRRRTLGG